MARSRLRPHRRLPRQGEYDPDEAIGVDGALQKLASHSYGDALLGFVAAGLPAYGVFCLARARYREI